MIRLAATFIANAAALLISSAVIAGVAVTREPLPFLALTGILTALNVFVRPALKLLFAPLILLTLGAFSLVLNAAILAALDFFREEITINGLLPLAGTTLIVGAANLIVHLMRGRR